jgi:ubiquinone/menaquinone biosynthesis C-methylase UbiE
MRHSDATSQDAVRIQRAYYAETAHRYDDMHVNEDDEHSFALRFMISTLTHLGVRSVLDIGCGTGRGLLKIKQYLPHIDVVGIEPSAELRQIGHANGLSEAELIDGNGEALVFADASVDLVCEFGALHHIPRPAQAVAEMLRVARKAIFISDSNNFGQGGRLGRLSKQVFNTARLWPLVDWIKTKGKGYTISEGDGLAYSYSVFNDYKQVRAKCKSIHLLSTSDSGPNLYRTSTHVALLGIKAQKVP